MKLEITVTIDKDEYYSIESITDILMEFLTSIGYIESEAKPKMSTIDILKFLFGGSIYQIYEFDILGNPCKITSTIRKKFTIVTIMVDIDSKVVDAHIEVPLEIYKTIKLSLSVYKNKMMRIKEGK